MPNKNDLSAFKINNKNTLQKSNTKVNTPIESVKAWRKPKSIADKESETVVLKLTKKELENLKARAGLVPLGTFVKYHLRNDTDFFK